MLMMFIFNYSKLISLPADLDSDLDKLLNSLSLPAVIEAEVKRVWQKQLKGEMLKQPESVLIETIRDFFENESTDNLANSDGVGNRWIAS
jgi:hypothetical protein